jgi:hypothetical protein
MDDDIRNVLTPFPTVSAPERNGGEQISQRGHCALVCVLDVPNAVPRACLERPKIEDVSAARLSEEYPTLDLAKRCSTPERVSPCLRRPEDMLGAFFGLSLLKRLTVTLPDSLPSLLSTLRVVSFQNVLKFNVEIESPVKFSDPDLLSLRARFTPFLPLHPQL